MFEWPSVRARLSVLCLSESVSLSDGDSQSATYICLLSVLPDSADMFKTCAHLCVWMHACEWCLWGCAYAYKVCLFVVSVWFWGVSLFKLLYIILATSVHSCVLLCALFVYVHSLSYQYQTREGSRCNSLQKLSAFHPPPHQWCIWINMKWHNSSP